jgi:hypothetical protein
MPKTPSYKLSISNIDEIGFTLHSVVMKPRHSTPLDLAAAAKNLRIDFHGENEDEIAIISRKIVSYLLTDFFVLSHRTGLYNRQLKLWEALASICEVKIAQLQQGFFKKIELPIWDFSMVDTRGRTMLLVRVALDVPHAEFDLTNEKGCKALIDSTIQRTERLRIENPLFAGVFLFCPKPAAEYVRSCLSTVTAIDDPVGKYESRLFSLPDVSFDLFEYDNAGDELRMLHPSLQKMSSSERTATT